MPDRKIAPPIKESVNYKIQLPPYEFFELKNKVPVYFINGGAEEVTKIDWVFDAGNSFEKKNSIAAAVAALLNNGTSKKNAFQISQHFEFYGAEFSAECFSEYAVLSLECLSKYLQELLPVVTELLTDAVFPENEIEIFKQINLQRLEVNLEKCEFVANREIRQLLYGENNPYGKKTEKADIQNIQRDDLVEFYNNFYLDAQCKIFASGKLPDGFTNMMDEYFGDLHLHKEKPFPLFERDAATKKKYRITNDPEGVQSAIRIARPFPSRKSPDFQASLVLNTVFGGYFGSRLMNNIREEKGYTYGIYSFLQDHLQYSSWMILTEAGKDVSGATIEEIYKEMKILREQPVGEEELMLVRNYLMGRQLVSLDGPFRIIDKWKSIILNNLDEKYFYDMINTIRNVSAKELQQLAQKYFVTDDFYEVAVV